MNAERRRALEKELQDILKITNPLVPATLDPNSPTAMSVPEVESEELDRLRKRPDVMTIADEVDAQLTQSMDSYMKLMRKSMAA